MAGALPVVAKSGQHGAEIARIAKVGLADRSDEPDFTRSMFFMNSW